MITLAKLRQGLVSEQPGSEHSPVPVGSYALRAIRAHGIDLGFYGPVQISALSNDKALSFDVILVSLGTRYQMYCANASRTYLVDPSKKQVHSVGSTSQTAAPLCSTADVHGRNRANHAILLSCPQRCAPHWHLGATPMPVTHPSFRQWYSEAPVGTVLQRCVPVCEMMSSQRSPRRSRV